MTRLEHKLDFLVLQLSWGGRIFGRIDAKTRRLHTPMPQKPDRRPDRSNWNTKFQTTGRITDAVLAAAEGLGLIEVGDENQPYHSDYELTEAGWVRAQKLQ